VPEDQEADTFQHPPEQPHPSTKEHDDDWDADLKTQGPVGLLIESVLWHGMAIDGDLKIWQKGEPPIDLINAPYQNLKLLLMHAAVRARTRAEWSRNTDNLASREIREIDRELSQVDKELTEEEKNMVKTSLMGGIKPNAKLQNTTKTSTRRAIIARRLTLRLITSNGYAPTSSGNGKSSELAEIPIECLPLNVRNGIAPAMKADGKLTYWGKKPK